MQSFQISVNDPNPENILLKYPEQYSLYQLGEFDDQTGAITTPSEPEFICTATELVEPSKNDELIEEIKSLRAQLSQVDWVQDVKTSTEKTLAQLKEA